MHFRVAVARGDHASCGTIAGSARHRRTWNPMSNELLVSYDTFPYQSHPFRQSHPDRLATIGQLFRHDASSGRGLPRAGDWLRIGWRLPADGGEPDRRVRRRRLAPRQVEEGRDDVRKLGLANVRLVAMDISDLPADLGAFDYIIAHGVYSWVPTPVQERLLALCRRHLTPSGIAYISYNALPGWRMSQRRAGRDDLSHARRHGARTPSGAGRAMLDFLEESTRDDVSAYGAMLKPRQSASGARPTSTCFTSTSSR